MVLQTSARACLRQTRCDTPNAHESNQMQAGVAQLPLLCGDRIPCTQNFRQRRGDNAPARE
ncbi:MAG: hypothetical protein DYG95_12275 [Chlorobi bacterium CHB1]|nr:hypothetical protein [Chlorobi bacterium CHB1]